MDDRGVSQCSKASSRGSQSYISENSKKFVSFSLEIARASATTESLFCDIENVENFFKIDELISIKILYD